MATEIEEVTATSSDIRDRMIRIEREMKESQDRQLIERLFSQINSGGLGIIGLDAALKALKQGQVNVLLVQQGFQQKGYVCTSCRSLLTGNGSCDYCEGKTQAVHDIVEQAMQEALRQNCQVKYITLAGSRLATAGSIGALLRYKPK